MAVVLLHDIVQVLALTQLASSVHRPVHFQFRYGSRVSRILINIDDTWAPSCRDSPMLCEKSALPLRYRAGQLVGSRWSDQPNPPLGKETDRAL
jgi:hypothetical protein